MRDANIRKNRESLLALELDELKTFIPEKTTKKESAPAAKSRKRKLSPQDTEDGDESDAKLSKKRAAQDITNTSGVRRSARNAGRVVDYKSEVVKTSPEVISAAAKIAANSEGKNTLERRHTPYVDSFAVVQSLTTARDVGNSMAIFPASRLANGGLPGTSRSKYYGSRIGHIYRREACSADSVHA